MQNKTLIQYTKGIFFICFLWSSYGFAVKQINVNYNKQGITTLCKNDTLIFIAPAMPNLSNYLWIVKNTFNSNILTTISGNTLIYPLKDVPFFDDDPNEGGINVKLYADTSGSREEFYDSKVLSIFNPPVIDLGGMEKKICPGTSILLKNTISPGPGSGAYAYLWSLGNTSISGDSIQVSTPGKYTLIITNTNNTCKISKSINVGNVPKPTITTSGTAVRCFGKDLQLFADVVDETTGNYSWEWASAQEPPDLTERVKQNPIVRPNGPATYAVKITDLNGCTDTGLKSVTVNPPITNDITIPDNTVLCKYNTTLLSNMPSGGTTFPSGDPYRYLWSPKEGLSDTAAQSPIVRPLSILGINYKLTVTDANNCSAVDSVTIFRHNLVFEITNFATEVSNICRSTSLTINTTATGGIIPYSYTWQKNGTQITNVSESLVTGPVFSDSKYVITVLDNNGCTDKDSLTATLIADPVPNVGSNRTKLVCGGNGSATIDITPLGSNSNDFKYEWSPSEGISATNIHNPTFGPDATNSNRGYVVTVTSKATGCFGVDNIAISTKPVPVFTIVRPNEDVFIQSVTGFSIAPTGFTTESAGYSYLWKITDDTTNFRSPAINEYRFDSSKTYLVKLLVTDNIGCSGADSIQMDIKRNSKTTVYIPNVFAPSASDPANTSFRIFAEKEDIKSTGFSAKVFNMFGEIVYKTDSFDEMNKRGWNGQKNNVGENYGSGVFTYNISVVYANGTAANYVGPVTLLR